MKQAIRDSQADKPEEPLLSTIARLSHDAAKQMLPPTFTDKDVPVIPRAVTTLMLAALLITQSVVPCCAFSRLLANCGRADAVSSKSAATCRCCPSSNALPESIPPSDETPREKCPTCDGLLFYSVSLDVASTVTEATTVAAFQGDTVQLKHANASGLSAKLQGQISGHSFLNIGTRLRI